MTRRKDRKSHLKYLGYYKVTDDHSGFEIKSTEAYVNWRGLVTSKNNYDPENYTDMVIKFPADYPLPYARPEGTDYYIPVTVPDYNPSPTPDHEVLTWDEIALDWDNWGVPWGTSTYSDDVEE